MFRLSHASPLSKCICNFTTLNLFTQ